MADNKPIVPFLDALEVTERPRKRRHFNMPDGKGPKKFGVRRLSSGFLSHDGDASEDLFRGHRVQGLGDNWKEGSAKVSRLFPDKTPAFRLLTRWVGDQLVADVKLEFDEAVMRELDAVGKVKYDRDFMFLKERRGVVYLRISEPAEHDELWPVTANSLQLGAWALKRLRVRIIAWAEEHL